MGTAKRERQKQGRQARLAHAQAAAARRKRRRTGLLLAGLVVALVAITLVMGGLGGDDDEEPVATGDASSTTAGASTPGTVAVTIPPPGETLEGETPCPAADGSSPRTTTFAQPPPSCTDPARTYTATITTSHGDITIELDQAAAPVTVNNFVVLARYHYYDGVTFHRIIPEFMIQAGDAVGPSPGQGGPGYQIPDELPAAGGTEGYPVGAVAMANSGPNTSGSQFFIMATGSTGLDAAYSVFARVTAGQEVVDEINQLGDAATNGTPTAEVVIQSITITEA